MNTNYCSETILLLKLTDWIATCLKKQRHAKSDEPNDSRIPLELQILLTDFPCLKMFKIFNYVTNCATLFVYLLL